MPGAQHVTGGKGEDVRQPGKGKEEDEDEGVDHMGFDCQRQGEDSGGVGVKGCQGTKPRHGGVEIPEGAPAVGRGPFRVLVKAANPDVAYAMTLQDASQEKSVRKKSMTCRGNCQEIPEDTLF